LQAQAALVRAYKRLRSEDAVPGSQSAYRITVRAAVGRRGSALGLREAAGFQLCGRTAVESRGLIQQRPLTQPASPCIAPDPRAPQVRQLEALVRLSEATARVYCSPEVRVEHVQEATKLLQASILKIEQGDLELDGLAGAPIDDVTGEELPDAHCEELLQGAHLPRGKAGDAGAAAAPGDAAERDQAEEEAGAGEGAKKGGEVAVPSRAAGVKISAKKLEFIKVRRGPWGEGAWGVGSRESEGPGRAAQRCAALTAPPPPLRLPPYPSPSDHAAEEAAGGDRPAGGGGHRAPAAAGSGRRRHGRRRRQRRGRRGRRPGR
jgi:hypothetical protein